MSNELSYLQLCIYDADVYTTLKLVDLDLLLPTVTIKQTPIFMSPPALREMLKKSCVEKKKLFAEFTIGLNPPIAIDDRIEIENQHETYDEPGTDDQLERDNQPEEDDQPDAKNHHKTDDEPKMVDQIEKGKLKTQLTLSKYNFINS